MPTANSGARPLSFKNIPRRYFLCFGSALIWGMLAHGMTLFNKYSLYEDPSQLFGVGATYISGRWMLDILHRMEVFFLGGSFSLPLVNGLTSILYLGLAACLLVWVLSVKRPAAVIAIGAISVTSPSVTGTFGYMFTAPHYALGTLLAVLGAALICKRRKWYNLVGGAVLIACAIGIYQATVPIALCVFLFSFIQQVSAGETASLKAYLLRILYFLAACAGFMAIYFTVNKLYLLGMNAELLQYQGIDTMGRLPIGTYLRRTLGAYKNFLFPDRESSACMYPGGMLYLYWVIGALTALGSLILLFRRARRAPIAAIFLLIPMGLIPMAVNFIYVMCDPESVHSLMVYSHVLLFVYALWLAEQLQPEPRKLLNYGGTGLCVLVLLLCSLYVRFDNICYLKAQLVQQQTISYCTTLVTQIKSTDGYTDAMPVAYVSLQSKEDASVKVNEKLDGVNIIPYVDTEDMLNNFAIRSFIENFCGFAPETDPSAYADHPEFQEMPCYPDAGSIKIIDGVVVVKCK